MSDYPGAIDYPAHPTNMLNPPPNVPKGWVLHTPEEPADDDPGTPRWFARPNVGGSTTYFVSYLGFVFQCVPENVGAIANGVTADRQYPTWADAGVSLNRQTLSVEIEGYAATIAQTISPAQKTALLRLLDYGCAKYNFPYDRAHIIGHYEVASNRSDPGTLDIDALVAELQEESMDQNAFNQMAEAWVAAVTGQPGDNLGAVLSRYSGADSGITTKLNDFIDNVIKADTVHDNQFKDIYERLKILEGQNSAEITAIIAEINKRLEA